MVSIIHELGGAFPLRLFSTMGRGIRNLLVRKSDKKTGQAAAVDDVDDAVDDSLNDTALGLDIWVQCVNPIVEYVSLIVFSVSSTCFAQLSYLFVNSS